MIQQKPTIKKAYRSQIHKILRQGKNHEIRILAGVENRLESLSAEIKEVKTSQDEIKNAITELQS